MKSNSGNALAGPQFQKFCLLTIRPLTKSPTGLLDRDNGGMYSQTTGGLVVLCPRCGSESDDEEFCTRCGHIFPETVEAMSKDLRPRAAKKSDMAGTMRRKGQYRAGIVLLLIYVFAVGALIVFLFWRVFMPIFGWTDMLDKCLHPQRYRNPSHGNSHLVVPLPGATLPG